MYFLRRVIKSQQLTEGDLGRKVAFFLQGKEKFMSRSAATPALSTMICRISITVIYLFYVDDVLHMAYCTFVRRILAMILCRK